MLEGLLIGLLYILLYAVVASIIVYVIIYAATAFGFPPRFRVEGPGGAVATSTPA